jgi:NADH dehydrogenase/NADH:ubiquinone oxidoreductase subunit G
MMKAECIVVTFNGKKAAVRPGTTILDAARSVGIAIPALCSHEALPAYGSCRLCIVELEEKGTRRIVTSCSTAAAQGMVIWTDGARVKKLRQTLVALLLAQAPEAAPVQQLAREMGIAPEKKKGREENGTCILCGLCVRTCAEIVGAHALSFTRKGAKREVAVPFFRDSRECIGCGACAFVCPTGFIKMHDVPDCGQPERIMETWKTRLALQACASDGLPFAPRAMLEHVASRYPTPEGFLESCAQCRRQNKKT